MDNLNNIEKKSSYEEKNQFPGLENHDGEETIILQIKCPIDDYTNYNNILFKHDNCGTILHINEVEIHKNWEKI